MIDFAMLQRLHDLPNDANASPQQRAEAKSTIANIEDEVVTEYLAMPENTWQSGNRAGQPKYESYKVLFARNCIEAGYLKGQNMPCWPLPDEADVIGNILLHRRYSATITEETV
jgi:hypothetical protein